MDNKNVRNLFQKIDREKLKKAMASDDPNELKKALEEEDIVLTEEQLDYVAGGCNQYDRDSETWDFAESYGPDPWCH